MGKFTDFFKGIGRGIKRGATKIYNGVTKVVPKVVDVIKRAPEYVDKAGRILSLLPGKYGKIGDLIHKGSQFVKPMIDVLPDSKAKEKINEYYNKGESKVNEYYNKGGELINNVNNKVQPWLRAGGDISRRLNNVIGGGGNKVLDGQFA